MLAVAPDRSYGGLTCINSTNLEIQIFTSIAAFNGTKMHLKYQTRTLQNGKMFAIFLYSSILPESLAMVSAQNSSIHSE